MKDHANRGYRKILSVGGDGTLNEVVNGIYTFSENLVDEFKIGVIPIGTGNDWCKMFNIPYEYKKAVEVVKKDKTMVQDVGCAEYIESGQSKKRYFVNVAGLGFDAVVLKQANEEKEKGNFGKLLYFKNILTNLLKYSYLPAELTIENKVSKIDLFSMNIGICKYSGNGMMQVPNAVPDDGLFDITVIKKLSKFEAVRNIKNLYDGSFIKKRFVDTYQADELKVNGAKHLRLEVDGEYIGEAPFQFSIIPKTLKVIVNI